MLTATYMGAGEFYSGIQPRDRVRVEIQTTIKGVDGVLRITRPTVSIQTLEEGGGPWLHVGTAWASADRFYERMNEILTDLREE